jgi:hypothetical protein
MGQTSMEKSVRINTINFNINGIHPYDTGVMRKNSFSREAVTSFQKNTLKRLRTKDTIMLKKKMISQ